MATLTAVHPDNRFSHPANSPLATQHLIEQTRQLFQHQGSDRELLQQIEIAIETISAHCSDRVTAQA